MGHEGVLGEHELELGFEFPGCEVVLVGVGRRECLLHRHRVPVRLLEVEHDVISVTDQFESRMPVPSQYIKQGRDSKPSESGVKPHGKKSSGRSFRSPPGLC